MERNRRGAHCRFRRHRSRRTYCRGRSTAAGPNPGDGRCQRDGQDAAAWLVGDAHPLFRRRIRDPRYSPLASRPRATAAANSIFWLAVRDHIERQNGLGPRLLIGRPGRCESDSTGFGATFADTPEQARAVVARYHAAGFQQMKLYTFLKPDVIQALAARVGIVWG